MMGSFEENMLDRVFKFLNKNYNNERFSIFVNRSSDYKYSYFVYDDHREYETFIVEGNDYRQIKNDIVCTLNKKDKEIVIEKDDIKTDFNKICTSLCKMIEEKDKRYGNSALQPLGIFAKHHNYGSRLDEKLARVKNSDELRKNDVADIIGGLILICKDKGWNNFDDQID